MDSTAGISYKPPSGLRHAQSLENLSWNSSPRKKYWPAVVDEVRSVY
jgi:hypothetical protein